MIPALTWPLHSFAVRVVLIAWTIFLLASCGSSDSGSARPIRPDPPTPVTLTLSTSETTLTEGSGEFAVVWVDISQPVSRTVWVELAFTGSATIGRDFDVDARTLLVRANQTRASTRLWTYDDWVTEDLESATVSMAAFSTATSAREPSSVAISIEDDGDVELTEIEKRGRAELFLFTDASFSADSAMLEVSVFNYGTVTASPTTLNVVVYPLTRPGQLGRAVKDVGPIEVPMLESRSRFDTMVNFDLGDLQPDRTYWTWAEIDQPSEERDRSLLPNRELNGFTLDSQGRILSSCEQPLRPTSASAADPLFEHQWSLQNTGQPAFAEYGGTAGNDLRMNDVLTNNEPTGAGVKVAVVDTGLEICHPDLVANVAVQESYNFRADSRAEAQWFNARLHDPYMPDSRGDHGTSVAGVIGAVADNGIGLRGVAPNVKLFGFNYLSEQCCIEDALGGSAHDPNSAQIDVFNMSFGSIGSQYTHPDDNIVRFGTSQLRRGLGAIYVKAAGNSFNRCLNVRHQIHDEIGCASSNGDAFNNQPYVMVVGALNAHGNKASYSSTGSNLWIAAPAGEYGVSDPATITTDQFGIERGYSSRNWPGIASNREANPQGDYGSNFNGTSAAAPHVAGAVALLLEEEPELTWRDVKHVVATTARREINILNSIDDREVMIDGELATVQRDWITNGANYMFHNHFGFGALDVDAALNFVRGSFRPNSLGEQEISDWITSATDVLNIPDHDGGGLEHSVNVDLPAGSNIEAVQLHVAGTHENLVDVSIELASPAGTRSILNPVYNNVIAGNSHLDWTLLSNAFYGESPRGVWTLKVIDVDDDDTGSLNSWSLRFWYGEHP